uniref:Uncharacterized protein n=1 Tax=viral metagenome TaxID=1070528 RepID=A0A2V0RKB5_9ZZZZ
MTVSSPTVAGSRLKAMPLYSLPGNRLLTATKANNAALAAGTTSWGAVTSGSSGVTICMTLVAAGQDAGSRLAAASPFGFYYTSTFEGVTKSVRVMDLSSFLGSASSPTTATFIIGGVVSALGWWAPAAEYGSGAAGVAPFTSLVAGVYDNLLLEQIPYATGGAQMPAGSAGYALGSRPNPGTFFRVVRRNGQPEDWTMPFSSFGRPRFEPVDL